MSNNNGKQTWNFWKNKGYYIALALCVVAVGVAGYVYYGSGQDTVPLNVVEDTAPSAANSSLENDEDSVFVIGTTPGTESPQVTAPTEKKTLETMWPVEGEVVSVFAADKLTYNTTTQDWRVHHGVDLQAAQGTQVLAAADGTVYTVYEDEILGTTVVIRHDGGFVTTYASLSPETMVAPGEVVTMGQAVGTVGQTALTEKALEHHVHFSVTCNGEVMDPSEFVKE